MRSFDEHKGLLIAACIAFECGSVGIGSLSCPKTKNQTKQTFEGRGLAGLAFWDVPKKPKPTENKAIPPDLAPKESFFVFTFVFGGCLHKAIPTDPCF